MRRGTREMAQCERLFGQERAEKISAHIEMLFEEPCPCKRGLACPLVPNATEAAEAASA